MISTLNLNLEYKRDNFNSKFVRFSFRVYSFNRLFVRSPLHLNFRFEFEFDSQFCSIYSIFRLSSPNEIRWAMNFSPRPTALRDSKSFFQLKLKSSDLDQPSKRQNFEKLSSAFRDKFESFDREIMIAMGWTRAPDRACTTQDFLSRILLLAV